MTSIATSTARRATRWQATALAVSLAAAAVVSSPGEAQASRPATAIPVAVDGLALGAVPTAMTLAEVADTLATDSTLQIGEGGRLMYVDDAPQAPAFAPSAGPEIAEHSTEVDDLAAGDVGTLHSKPDANLTIWLDFDGATVTGTAWNASTGQGTLTADAFDLNGNPGSAFTDAEKAYVAETFLRVSEAFSAWDVDVTTEEPSADRLDRPNNSDTEYGVQVIVTNDSSMNSTVCGSCGGVAYIDVFDSYDGQFGADREYYLPAWSFQGLSPSYTAATIAHEVGHNLGLSHDGNSGATYDSGNDIWGPIMGAAFTALNMWNDGDYPDANQHQDDLAIITTQLPVRVDDHGDSNGAATVVNTGTAFTYDAILSPGDVDVFEFTIAQGTLELLVESAPEGPTLDARLLVKESGGSVLADENPVSDYDTVSANGFGSYSTTGMGAETSLELSAGTYYVTVLQGDRLPIETGYSTYGSIGQYTLSGLLTPSIPAPPAEPEPVVVQQETRKQAEVTWDDVSFEDNYRVFEERFDDGLQTWSDPIEVALLDADVTALSYKTAIGTVRYSVQAENEQGTSDPVVSQAFAVGDRPDKPSNASVVKKDGDLIVKWQDNSDNETKFLLYRQTWNYDTDRWNKPVLIGNAAADKERATLTGEPAGKTRYRVSAKNDLGISNKAATGAVNVR